jgi:uncharacterized RDD family membrane protein YckC
MKNIEIKTTQNVVLEYELADLRDRILAFVIDQVCLIIGLSILFSVSFGGLMLTGVIGSVVRVVLSLVYVFYSLGMEVLNDGQSIGKMAMRIKVIKTTGSHGLFSDYAARWIFRMIDIYFSFGGIASILIASSAKAQRIGDIVANTAVIKLAPHSRLKLKDLLSIHSQDSYKPTYLQARQLAEEDVLLIKSTLDRYRQYRNPAHSQAMDQLATRIVEVLGIENVDQDRKQFLQTILKDYVVLTR